jgi:hypothetical protein
MRQIQFICATVVTLLGFSQQAHADCAIIDQLDKLYILQTRLANNPDTALFRDDIRQLRMISQNISNQDAVRAVDGNAIIGKGAGFVQFLENTQSLLRGTSLDDPFSVQSHFTRSARQNLQNIGGYLTDLRCTDTQIALDRAQRAADPTRSNSDAEDLQEVAEVLKQLMAEIFRWRTLVIVVVLSITCAVAIPQIRRWVLIRRRRAKRHSTSYPTHYTWAERTCSGTLVDINCHGTKLQHEAGNPLPLGALLEVAINGEMTAGAVKWSNVHYSGVQFDTSIDLEQVYAICAAASSLATTQNGAPRDAVS